MTKRVLIIGGYGNFGSFIARYLSREPDILIIIAGRSEAKAKEFAASLAAKKSAEFYTLDINDGLEQALRTVRPDIVIHTSGPYQSQGYGVAHACIKQGCHYIDLADARDFVTRIEQLNEAAKAKNVLICSGASSVPCLTAALMDHYKEKFSRIEKIYYGIATAQLTNRGLATTSAVLSYAGKPFKTLIGGRMVDIYGWSDLTTRKFMELGPRLLGNCDIPDLEIFPKRYPDLQTIRFHAGLELKILHLGLWFLSKLVRWRILPSLQGSAPALLKISKIFDMFGKDDSGFYMRFCGIGHEGQEKEAEFNLVAHHSDGLYIPSMPAILMAKKLARDEIKRTGACACVGFITAEEYLAGLSEFNIRWEY